MNQKFLCDFYRMTGKKYKRNIKSYLNIMFGTCIGGESEIRSL